MFISRQLRLALLISFTWHLFWLSSVSIVNLTAGLKPRQYSTVNFLGSILNSRVSLRDPQRGFIELPAEADLQRKNYFKERPYTLLHGGKIIELDELDKFAGSLPSRSVPITETWVRPLWDLRWISLSIFLLILIAFSGEWTLRRWRGMP